MFRKTICLVITFLAANQIILSPPNSEAQDAKKLDRSSNLSKSGKGRSGKENSGKQKSADQAESSEEELAKSEDQLREWMKKAELIRKIFREKLNEGSELEGRGESYLKNPLNEEEIAKLVKQAVERYRLELESNRSLEAPKKAFLLAEKEKEVTQVLKVESLKRIVMIDAIRHRLLGLRIQTAIFSLPRTDQDAERKQWNQVLQTRVDKTKPSYLQKRIDVEPELLYLQAAYIELLNLAQDFNESQRAAMAPVVRQIRKDLDAVAAKKRTGSPSAKSKLAALNLKKQKQIGKRSLMSYEKIRRIQDLIQQQFSINRDIMAIQLDRKAMSKEIKELGLTVKSLADKKDRAKQQEAKYIQEAIEQKSSKAEHLALIRMELLVRKANMIAEAKKYQSEVQEAWNFITEFPTDAYVAWFGESAKTPQAAIEHLLKAAGKPELAKEFSRLSSKIK